MRVIALSKTGINKIRSHQQELKVSDFEDSVKSIPPGEWCLFKSSPAELWIGFINPLIEEKFSCSHLLQKISPQEVKAISPEKFILQKLEEAYKRRQQFKGYGKNSRLFYGVSDGLPGLIIDSFENASIIQINTSGVDRFRELIKDKVKDLTGTASYLLDNPKYREKEFLPTFESESLPELQVVENGLRYKIRPEVLQKVGFYYDHRENRLQLMNLIFRTGKTFNKGVDLFSYAGAWGTSALKAGVQQVDFVDQGDFSHEVNTSLELNDLKGRGAFLRQDVFKFIDEMIQKGENYDLVLCDPPAFAKSHLQKSQALEGYSKLHRKVFKILSPESLVAFSSCTHYVGHEEFQKNVLDAAYKESRNIQLLYSGIQGFDHPVTSLSDRSNYIKSYIYMVE